MKVLTITLRFIGVVQIILGVLFMIIPNQFAEANGLDIITPWVLWMFVQMGARFIGYGIGMFAAATDPTKHKLWIDTMIFIQILDWIGTVYYLSNGVLSIGQVATAPYFPIIFIAVLGYYRRRL